MDAFWSEHTVESRGFKSVEESTRYLDWRFEQYPLHREFMDLYGSHDGETILDYGCGPGSDTVGFLLYSRARKVIGVDVSPKALSLAEKRIRLHDIARDRYDLRLTSNSTSSVDLADDSVDYVHCSGVLQHVTDPSGVLLELYRLLRRGGRGRVMVYNRESLWFHLYTAYERMILQGLFAGMSVVEAFARNTDGPDCPISRCWTPSEFITLAAGAGFDVQFVGGNLSLVELDSLRRHGKQAQNDSRLDVAHRTFLKSLTFSREGFPMYAGHAAGIGAVFRLSKA